MTDTTGIVGTWNVEFKGDNWVYRFDEDGKVFWRNLGMGFSPVSGLWSNAGSAIAVKWPSGTTESWKLPIDVSGQTGTMSPKSGSGKFSAKKRSADFGKTRAEGQTDPTACWAACIA